MKTSLLLAASLALSLALPSSAQEAPGGWKTQTRAQNATTYTPPDLRAGEVYNVTIYDAKPLGGKSLGAYLRDFAGTVGSGPGQLTAPLTINATRAQAVTGVGAYNGPGGKSLNVMFVGFSLDGTMISVARTLLSDTEVVTRYKTANETLLGAMVERVKVAAGENAVRVPSRVLEQLQPGGALVPGVYAGDQLEGEKLKFRFRLYLYPDGKYHFKTANDTGFQTSQGAQAGVGKSVYNAATGQLSFGLEFNLLNDPYYSAYCFYGRDASGKPAIIGYFNFGFAPIRTSLVRVGPIPPPPAPTPAQLREIAKQKKDAADQAKRDRFKWVVAPGKGVKNAQIAAIVCNSVFMNGGMSTDVYLLLRDGSVDADLPDELDVARSKQKEPDKWGRWRKDAKGDFLVTWKSGKWEDLDGFVVVPAPLQTKLQGHWGAGRSTSGPFSSFALWGVSFNSRGRFAKDSRGGTSSIGLPDANGNVAISSSDYNENGSSVGVSGPGYALGSETKRNNPNGSSEGSYSLYGWVLTLRYDDGKVVRLPFFFFNKTQQTLFFEGSTMAKDDK